MSSAELVSLRELSRMDLSVINSWRNNQELIRWLGAPFRYVNIETDEAWFENYQRNRTSQVRLAIVLKSSHELVGMVNLTGIDLTSRGAELSIQIGVANEWGKGIGTCAIGEALSHAFNNLNLHRVHLTALAVNTRAIHVYERLGFRHEGLMREAVFKGGQYHDLVIMAILRDEFAKRAELK